MGYMTLIPDKNALGGSQGGRVLQWVFFGDSQRRAAPVSDGPTSTGE